MNETMTQAAFAAAVLACSGCATDTRYHEKALVALSEPDRWQCEQVADAATARAGTHSLRDLTAVDWSWATFGFLLPLYVFEIRRMNETERQRAYEAALQDCLTPLIEQE